MNAMIYCPECHDLVSIPVTVVKMDNHDRLAISLTQYFIDHTCSNNNYPKGRTKK